MKGRSGLREWWRYVVAFGGGILAGLIVEYALAGAGSSGPIAGGLGFAAALAAVFAVLIQETFQRARERGADQRHHADLLNTEVFASLPNAGPLLQGYELSSNPTPEGRPDWRFDSTPPTGVWDLPNWPLAQSHIQTTPKLDLLFNDANNRLTARPAAKTRVDRIFVDAILRHTEKTFGPGFIAVSDLTSPEPAKWVNVAAVASWIRSAIFDPRHMRRDYQIQAGGPPYRMIGGGTMVLTSDEPIAKPPEDFDRLMRACLEDGELRGAWSEWQASDKADRESLGDFDSELIPISHLIRSTHVIPGTCAFCPLKA